MNKPSRFSLAILAIGLLVVGAACQPKNENENNNDDSNTNAAVNQNRNVSDDAGEDDANVNSSSNVNASDDDQDDDTNVNRSTNTNSSDDNDDSTSDAPAGLRIAKPEKGETVSSPFEVSGKAYAATVTVRILNAAGKKVVEVPVTVRNNEYKVNLSFEFTNTTSGTIEVEDSEGTTTRASVTFKVETNNDGSDDGTNGNTNTSDDSSNY